MGCWFQSFFSYKKNLAGPKTHLLWSFAGCGYLTDGESRCIAGKDAVWRDSLGRERQALYKKGGYPWSS